jgi:hypothetical protein
MSCTIRGCYTTWFGQMVIYKDYDPETGNCKLMPGCKYYEVVVE